MRNWKNAARPAACLLALLLILGSLPMALAAQPSEEAQAETQDTLGATAETAGVPVPDIPEAAYFKDFAYGQNILFSGIYKTHKFYFQVPEYWDCRYVYAQLEVELSQLIQDVPASLTVLLNDDPVATYQMDYRGGSTQVLRVTLPVEELKTGFNSLGITGYVRLYDDDGCVDDFSGANWISVRGTSFVQVGYELKDVQNKLAAYPYPLISSLDESGSRTAILVSDRCEPEELTAALLLRADLGSETELEDNITLARLSDAAGEELHRVVVALRGNLDDRYRAAAEAAAGDESLEKTALVHYMEEDGTDTLLITSDSGEALVEAAMMLMDEDRLSQEKGDTAFVREHAADPIRTQIGTDVESGKMTLDSLAGTGLYFSGPFRQSEDIYLPFSGGYVLAESGMVELNFRYSENLDFDRSVVTVFWGDVPVSSKRLSRENAGGDTLSFTMPQDVVGTYAGKITITFDLELPDLFCTPRMDEMPWAYVTGDSSFYLPVGAGGSFSLSQRPYPFEVSSRFNELNVVIPEHITAAELDTLGRVVALYGEQPSPYGSLSVSYADAMTARQSKPGNLLVVGTYADNSMIRELNGSLGFRYSANGVSFLSNDAMVLSERYSSGVATMQLFPSPYADGRAVLVVGALDDAGMQNLRSFLSDSENVWKLEKDTALVDSDLELHTFQLAQKKSSVPTPILKRMLESNREATIFTLVAVGAMALFLLAGILILIRIYWRQKK